LEKTMDHKLLLLKYMDYINDMTGSELIWNERANDRYPSRFKKEEWDELVRLSEVVAGVSSFMDELSNELEDPLDSDAFDETPLIPIYRLEDDDSPRSD